MHRILWIIILVFLSINISYSQNWFQLNALNNSPSNDELGDIIEKDTNLYFASKGGIYKSSDYGKNWNYSSNGLYFPISSSIYSLTSNSSGIYASFSGGVYKSVDSGQTWTLVNNGITLDPNNNYFDKILSLGDTLFVHENDRGTLYMSIDNGASWIISSGYKPWLDNVYVVGSSVYFSNTDFNSIKRSADGINFSDLSISGLSGTNKYSFCGTDQNLFLISNDSVFAFTGGTWNSRMSGIPVSEKASFITYKDNVLTLITNNHLYSSLDSGISWSHITIAGIPSSAFDYTFVRKIFPIKRGYVCTTAKGLYYLPNGDSSWISINNGLNITDIQELTVQGSALFRLDNSNNVVVSYDKGGSWTVANDGLPYINKYSGGASLRSSINNVYALIYNPSISLYKTHNGSLWNKIIIPPITSNLHWTGNLGDTIFITGNNGFNHFFRSKNGGTTWEDISLNVNDLNFIYNLAGNNSSLIANQSSGNNQRIVKSTDLGDSWSISSIGLDTTDTFFPIIVPGSGNDFFIVQRPNSFPTIENQTIFRSLDNGDTWQEIAKVGLPNNLQIEDLKFNKGVLYVTLTEGGIFRSADKGEIWESIQWNLPPQVTGKLGFIDTIAYLDSYYHGFWSTTNPPTTNPVGYDDAQFNVYPNPSEESINFEYALNENSPITISLFNNQGGIVKQYQEEGIRGNNKFTINVSEIPSGLYFVQISYPGLISTKKLIIGDYISD